MTNVTTLSICLVFLLFYLIFTCFKIIKIKSESVKIVTLAVVVKLHMQPAPVVQWLARQTVGRKVWGSNPIRVMWDFSALAGSYQSWECYGPSGKTGTTQPSFIHFTDASLRVLL